MEQKSNKIPNPVLKRLPRYLTHVREIRKDGVAWISSQRLAEALGLTSSTVRQDLSHLQLIGVSKRGYRTEQLEEEVKRELGGNIVHRVVVVGAGYLGCALVLHGDLARHGFDVCGIFDADPEILGTKVGGLNVRPMESLATVVRDQQVEIGVIAVPSEAAQAVGDRLVQAGVKGLLNLAYIHLRPPPGVYVVDARLIASLQELAYAVRYKNGATHS
jgi:redox-sensing transcriptional repressor